MPYKDLEHDGEKFENLLSREDVKNQEVSRAKKEIEQDEEHTAIAQESYMNLENPRLWDGEI